MLYNIKDFTKELKIYNTIEFKKLNNFDNYFIYEDGRVFSIKRNRFLALQEKYGYNNIILVNNDNTRKYLLVHRIVYEAFKGPIPKELQVDHINGIRNDNRLINLRLLTNKENSHNKHYLEQYKEISKIKYLKRKEKVKEYSKKRYDENADKFRKYSLDYYYNHREEINKRRKERKLKKKIERNETKNNEL